MENQQDQQNSTSGRQSYLEKLPPQLREFIYSPEMSKILEDISKKNQLHIDQLASLEAEVAAAMMGITKTEDLQQNISEVLNVGNQKGAAIAKDVNDLLFIKVRELMKKDYEASKTPPPTVAVQPSAVQQPPSIHAAPVVSTLTAPIAKPMQPASATPPSPVIPVKPAAPAVDLSSADAVLSKPTVSVAPQAGAAPTQPNPTQNAAPAPVPYKADPYREPPE